MFRKALLAASLVAFAACSSDQATEPVQTAAAVPVAPKSDNNHLTYHGTLKAVLLAPADSTDSTAVATLVWDLVISDSLTIRLAGDKIGPAPMLDGQLVFVTGVLEADGSLMVESYIIDIKPNP